MPYRKKLTDALFDASQRRYLLSMREFQRSMAPSVKDWEDARDHLFLRVGDGFHHPLNALEFYAGIGMSEWTGLWLIAAGVWPQFFLFLSDEDFRLVPNLIPEMVKHAISIRNRYWRMQNVFTNDNN